MEKSKYDLMEEESRRSTMLLLMIVGKAYASYQKLKKNKIDRDRFNDTFYSTVDKGLPHVKMMAHIGYENSLDLEKVDKEVLYKYMIDNGLKREEFIKNYKNNINTYAKIILAFDIIEEENINIYKVLNLENLRGLIKGNLSGINNILIENGYRLEDKNRTLLDKIISDNFDLNDLDDSEKARLNSNHREFMNQNIKGMSKKSTYNQVYGFAKKLGSKKSVVDL